MSECIEQQLKQRAAEARANGLPNCADALEAAANEIIGLGDMIDSIATDNERQSAEIEQQQKQLDTIFRLALDALSSAGSGPEFEALNAIYWHAKGDAEPGELTKESDPISRCDPHRWSGVGKCPTCKAQDEFSVETLLEQNAGRRAPDSSRLIGPGCHEASPRDAYIERIMHMSDDEVRAELGKLTVVTKPEGTEKGSE